MECNKCEVHGLRFRRSYDVTDFLEGFADSPVWIVGLNPAAASDWHDGRSVADLRNNFSEHARRHSYFRDFERVSPWLFSTLGKPAGTAHTDLVKCSSKSWPPHGCSSRAAREVQSNCKPFLEQQIEKFRPSLIVCNGADVSQFVGSIIPPKNELGSATSYCGTASGIDVWVVLSGFIGRIDNYARRRLGVEIEEIATMLGLKT